MLLSILASRVRILPLIFMLLLMIASGCSRNDDALLSGSGFVEADEVMLSAEIGGRIEHLRFDESESVKRGDTLAIIDTSSIDLELASLDATIQVAISRVESSRTQLSRARETEKFATRERERIEKLLASGTTTQRQLDQLLYEEKQAKLGTSTAQSTLMTSEQEVVRLQADLKRLQRRRLDCFPISPLDGTVLERLVERGELASPGKGLFKLAALDTVKVKIYLGTAALSRLQVGQSVSISTESGGSSHSGSISMIADEAEFAPKNVQTAESRADLVYAITIVVPNQDHTLKIGMPVFVTATAKSAH